MRFKAVNELEHFSFRDAQIQKAEWTGDALRFELEAVIVKADNSQMVIIRTAMREQRRWN